MVNGSEEDPDPNSWIQAAQAEERAVWRRVSPQRGLTMDCTSSTLVWKPMYFNKS